MRKRQRALTVSPISKVFCRPLDTSIPTHWFVQSRLLLCPLRDAHVQGGTHLATIKHIIGSASNQNCWSFVNRPAEAG